MTIGDRIKVLRERAGLSQDALGEKAGVKQNTVSKWERGESEPRRPTLRRVAKALSVSISALELGDDAPELHKIRLMGYVGAGQAIETIAGDPPWEWVDPPPGTPEGAEAAIVRGGSMLPLLANGTMLVWWRWTPDPTPYIGEMCVIRLAADNAMLVKIVEPGSRPGLWSLHSLAAGYEPIRDVRIAGVAPIGIIYRRGLFSV